MSAFHPKLTLRLGAAANAVGTSPLLFVLTRQGMVMARSNHPLWIFLLVASPSLADPRESAQASSTKNVRDRSADKLRILADEHGTLLADEHGTLLADEHGTLLADEPGTLLADEHGTQVLADEHGRLVLDTPPTSRPTESE
jgi:hypothetical protein